MPKFVKEYYKITAVFYLPVSDWDTKRCGKMTERKIAEKISDGLETWIEKIDVKVEL